MPGTKRKNNTPVFREVSECRLQTLSAVTAQKGGVAPYKSAGQASGRKGPLEWPTHQAGGKAG